MSRLGSPFARRGGGRGSADVDPVLAAILGVVIVAGGGLAAYGATQDTTPAAAPAPVVQNDDPVVARALAVVSRADGGSATGEPTTAADAKREATRAQRASRKGRAVDPFGAGTSTSASGAAATTASGGSSTATTATSSSGSSSSSSGSTSVVELARRAAAEASAATGTTAQGSSGSSSSTSTSTSTTPTTPTTATPSTSTTTAAARAAARRRALAARPARVSLRVVTAKGRSSRSKRAIGLLVPNAAEPVARVVAVSASNEVVTLRLRSGAALAGEQSKGTRCIQRLESGQCRLVRVRTGRTAVIRAAATAAGAPAAVTALRVLSVWRGGVKVAD